MPKKYQLCVELMTCASPLDEDVVYGVVEALLVAGLPATGHPTGHDVPIVIFGIFQKLKVSF